MHEDINLATQLHAQINRERHGSKVGIPSYLLVAIVMLRFMNSPHLNHLSLCIYDDAFEHACESDVG